MSQLSPRLRWPVPAEGADPWLDAFTSMVNAMDGSAYAAREDRHTLFMEGGIFTWNASPGVLSWTTSIEVLSALTGFKWLIAPSSVALKEGDILWVDLVRGPTQNVNVAPQVSTAVPSSDSAQIVGIRRNNRIYFRFGYVLLDGQARPIFSTPAAGAGVIQTENVIPTPKDVTGNVNTYVGSVYLLAGNIQFGRTMLGSQSIGDTAHLTILRNSDSALLTTINGPGLLAARTVSNISVSEGWYDLYVASNNAIGVATCGGVFFEIV